MYEFEFVFLILLVAGISDLKKREVNAWFSNIALISSVFLVYFLELSYYNLLVGLIIFVISFIGYHKKLIGGADVKIITSISLLISLWVIGVIFMSMWLLIIYKIKNKKKNPLAFLFFIGFLIVFAVKLIMGY